MCVCTCSELCDMREKAETKYVMQMGLSLHGHVTCVGNNKVFLFLFLFFLLNTSQSVWRESSVDVFV